MCKKQAARLYRYKTGKKDDDRQLSLAASGSCCFDSGLCASVTGVCVLLQDTALLPWGPLLCSHERVTALRQPLWLCAFVLLMKDS